MAVNNNNKVAQLVRDGKDLMYFIDYLNLLYMMEVIIQSIHPNLLLKLQQSRRLKRDLWMHPLFFLNRLLH